MIISVKALLMIHCTGQLGPVVNVCEIVSQSNTSRDFSRDFNLRLEWFVYRDLKRHCYLFKQAVTVIDLA